jgi:phosphoglycolate phosphatase
MKQRHLLFDLDGTLCDPGAGIVHCLQHALRELGVAAPEQHELSRYIGPPLHDSLTVLLDSHDTELIRRAVDLYRRRFVSSGMFESTLYPGISDALEALAAAGYQLLIVTSKPTVFARGIIEHIGLARLFKAVYGSELDGTRGRKQELIAHALQQEAIGANHAVMIGDREHDIRGAIANGVRPVGVLWGYGSREELTGAGASILCDAPASLPSHCSNS